MNSVKASGNLSSGTVVAMAATGSVSPTSINFGNQGIDQPPISSRTVTLTNTGDSTLFVSSFSITSPFIVIDSTCDLGSSDVPSRNNLSPGQSCTFQLAFAPSEVSPGIITGSFIIFSNAANSPQTVSLVGNAVQPRPIVSVSPTALIFENTQINTTSPPQAVRISNLGTAPIDIFFEIAGNEDFQIADEIGGGTLPPGVTFQIPIVFSPLAPGPRSARLLIKEAQDKISSIVQLIGNSPDLSSRIEFAQRDFSVNEAAGSATITVRRSGGTTTSSSVSFFTTEGTAINGTDFVSSSGTLMFPPGATALTFNVRILDDNRFTGSRFLGLTLANPVGATLGGVNIAQLTILDDETRQPGQLQIGNGSFITDEGGSTTVTVTRTNGATVPVSVGYTLGGPNSTAVPDVDYENTFGVLNFGVGSTSQSFTIRTFNNGKATGDRLLEINLTAATNGATLGLSRALLTIRDVDKPPTPPKLLVSDTVDFGSVEFGTSATRTVTMQNDGETPLTFSLPTLTDGGAAGFALGTVPRTLTIEPKQTTTFEVLFRPTTASNLILGKILVSSNGGDATINLRGQSLDRKPPTVSLITPISGQALTAGIPFIIAYNGSDDDSISNFVVGFSINGTNVATTEVARVSGSINQVVWNVPETLRTSSGRIIVTATDRSGNSSFATSDIFSVQAPAVPPVEPSLQVVISFDPPPMGQVAPPQNVRADATEVDAVPKDNKQEEKNSTLQTVTVDSNQITTTPILIGYNIFRVVQPPPDQPQPTPEQIVGNPANLVGSLPATTTTFIDTVSTSKGDNFVYSVTSNFNTGDMSNGSRPAGTDLPVIKNPRFERGTIFIDGPGSFIKPGAMLTINENETYPLEIDSTGIQFTVPKRASSTPGGIRIRRDIRKGSTVKLTVKNPDGKLSVGKEFTRQ
ncbi:MAG: choice-of-anchor D domain-containing protein [Blastocatellia bacterium]|nr:choice-of-anchor D domain-containing protein [Blastocatellia bacterium]